ncbi:hypothetical protein K432DRAFT_384863 [Lepidopterella palustris CBS 459.81]|uniref:Uncharacterized protein n=1 Tax=Lepidopterella palustris CBS 459.81 TaxID=1314670 RepID=A0A8E2E4H5_9PEZI|nr:hypothetical protein K432DRAFT_384863 [Lepidopterella palustris CBS 459.81]
MGSNVCTLLVMGLILKLLLPEPAKDRIPKFGSVEHMKQSNCGQNEVAAFPSILQDLSKMHCYVSGGVRFKGINPIMPS